MSDRYTVDALERATQDDAVKALAALQRVVDLALPDTWATWVWNNVYVPLSDAAYLASARWHTYLAGCRGRRP